jgi:hypothetical protein
MREQPTFQILCSSPSCCGNRCANWPWSRSFTCSLDCMYQNHSVTVLRHNNHISWNLSLSKWFNLAVETETCRVLHVLLCSLWLKSMKWAHNGRMVYGFLSAYFSTSDISCRWFTLNLSNKFHCCLFFILGLPCIINYVYNYQIGALFILSLLN